MTIKYHSDLALLSLVSQKSNDEFSEKLIEKLVEKEFLFDDSENYGKTIGSVIDGTLKISVFTSVLRALNIPLRSEYILKILSLKIKGFGGCEECGGEMVVIDGEYRNWGGGDSPDELIPIWEEKECSICGHITEQ